MTAGVQIVLSNPVYGREQAYHQWYREHLLQMLVVPGVVAARRFVASAAPPSPCDRHRYLALYEFSDIAQAAAVIAERLGTDSLQLSDALDRQNIHTANFEPIGPTGHAVDASIQSVAVILTKSADISDIPVEGIPGATSIQLFRLSGHQLRATAYPLLLLVAARDEGGTVLAWAEDHPLFGAASTRRYLFQPLTARFEPPARLREGGPWRAA